MLRDVSFELEKGEAYALVGPTGGEGLLPQRCDFAFRDLRTAALEILAREAVTTPSDT